jgi:hypothetical protein
MTFHTVGIRFALAVGSLLVASPAHAECITPGEWWLRESSVERVFSGTAVEITRTADLGYRATFDVDRVWKGTVPRRLDLYVWELQVEMNEIVRGRKYLVGATRLIEARERQGVGLAGTGTVAYTEIRCGAPEYREAEETGILRAMGVGAPPDQPPADFAFKFDFKPCVTNTLDTFRHVYTREMGLGDPLVSIPLTLSTEQMAAVYDAIGSIGFFNYPTKFLGVKPTATDEITVRGPSTTYRLEVRSSGVMHIVSWDDRFFPHTEEASRLLKLFDLINGIVNGRPEVKRLPVSRAGCL